MVIKTIQVLMLLPTHVSPSSKQMIGPLSSVLGQGWVLMNNLLGLKDKYKKTDIKEENNLLANIALVE